MSKPRRTAEDVCIEYAIAVAAVREQTAIVHKHSCTEGNRQYTAETGEEECLDRHFRIEVYQAGDDRPMERPELAAEDMCENCQIRLKALDTRRGYRKRLGAAKRAVEIVGKRLNAGSPNATS